MKTGSGILGEEHLDTQISIVNLDWHTRIKDGERRPTASIINGFLKSIFG